MTRPQLEAYDVFLDENDWDIYYWATQEATPPPEPVKENPEAWRMGKPRSGEWAQTVGTFKPAYRPVPARWEGSEVLTLLRDHVETRSAAGASTAELEEKGPGGGGLGFMPVLKDMRTS